MNYRTSLPLHETEFLDEWPKKKRKNKSKGNNRSIKDKRRAHKKQLKKCGKKTLGSCKVVKR